MNPGARIQLSHADYHRWLSNSREELARGAQARFYYYFAISFQEDDN